MGDGKRPRGASQRGSGSISLHVQRVQRVEEAFRSLPSRLAERTSGLIRDHIAAAAEIQARRAA